MHPSKPLVFVPDVGALWKPGSVLRDTNRLDFWATNPVNRWGFADREPPPRSRTEKSCHVTVLGDSFVDALEVPIAAKMHVQLEELAAAELPQLDVTTSAFGWGGTGQVGQLPYYDKYARTLKPKLMVLVFVRNDFKDNARLRDRHMGLERAADGMLRLRPPNPRWKPPRPPPPGRSFLAQWLRAKRFALRRHRVAPAPPRCLDCTRFALRQFEIRARRDHVSLVILSGHSIRGARAELLARVADGLPVISLSDYLAARGIHRREIRWNHDNHWNPTGHRLVAEALLEYIRANPSVCSAKIAAIDS